MNPGSGPHTNPTPLTGSDHTPASLACAHPRSVCTKMRQQVVARTLCSHLSILPAAVRAAPPADEGGTPEGEHLI